MSDDLAYRILAYEPKYKALPLTKKEKDEVEGLNLENGIALWVVIAGVIIIIVSGLSAVLGLTYGVAAMIGTIVGTLGASVAIALISPSVKKKNILILEEKRTKEAKAAHQVEVLRLKNEAKSLTSSLIRTYKASLELVAELRQHHEQASLLLQHAESEFNSNAFDPFWEAVENAAQHLLAFNTTANLLSQYANEYYSTLNKKKTHLSYLSYSH